MLMRVTKLLIFEELFLEVSAMNNEVPVFHVNTKTGLDKSTDALGHLYHPCSW